MNIVNAALQEDQQSLVRICVQITDKIMEGNLEYVMEIYMELIQALIKLTKNSDLKIVIKAINQLEHLMEHIATSSLQQ